MKKNIFKKIHIFSYFNSYCLKALGCTSFGFLAGINVSLPSNSFVTIISLAAAFILLQNCKNIVTQCFLIFCWTLSFISAGTFWIAIAIYDPLLTPLLTACLVASSLYVVHSLIYTFTYFTVNRIIYLLFFRKYENTNTLLLAISVSLSFGISEFIRSNGSLAMPWGFIGYTQTSNPLLSGIYPVAGSYGVTTITTLISIIIVLISKSIFLQFSSNTKFNYFSYFKNHLVEIILLIVFFSSLILLNYIEWTHENDKKLNIRIVHTHIPNFQKYDLNVQNSSIKKIITLSSLKDVNLTIYPELYLVKPAYDIDKKIRTQIVQSVITTKNAQLFGIPDSEVTKDGTILGSLNVMLQIDAFGETKRYAKEILLPFSEYMPSDPLLVWAMPYIFKFPLANFNSGKLSNKNLLQVDGMNLAISICNEIAYSNNIHRHASNAQILINSASDSWIPNQIYALHSWQINKVRAMETQKTLLRSSNTGYSGYIDPWGNEIKMQYGVETTQKYEIIPRFGNTPYTNLAAFISKY